MEQVDGPQDLFPGLNTPMDRLAIAITDGVRYLADPLNVQKADSFARSAHILAEWVVTDYGAFGYQSQEDCREDIYQRCPKLKAIRDFSNMAKHGGRLDERRRPYFRSGKLHEGAFSEDFALDFDILALVLVMPDETKISYEDVVTKAMRFWEEFFATHCAPES